MARHINKVLLEIKYMYTLLMFNIGFPKNKISYEKDLFYSFLFIFTRNIIFFTIVQRFPLLSLGVEHVTITKVN